MWTSHDDTALTVYSAMFLKEMKKTLIVFFFIGLFLLASCNQECPLNSSSALIHIDASNVSIPAREERQQSLDDCNPEIIEGCCICNNSSYYVCDSLDDALSLSGLVAANKFQLTLDSAKWNLMQFHQLTVESFTLHGTENASIHCSNGSGGLELTDASTHMENVTISNCSSGDKKSSVSLINNYKISLRRVSFNGNPGTGLVINVHKDDESWEQLQYNITDNQFLDNGNVSVHAGGGLNIYIDTKNRVEVTVNIIGSIFQDNKADYGGGLHYSTNYSPLHKLYISDCTFISNKASNDGGGISFNGNNGVFTGLHFIDNEANRYGGAIYQFLRSIENDNCQINGTCQHPVEVYQDCHWRGNTAQGGSVIAITSYSNYKLSKANFTNCTVKRNRVQELLLFSRETACTMFIDGTQVNLVDTILQQNYGTGLCLIDADATFSGKGKFTENKGHNGGAILVTYGVLKINAGTDLTFTMNRAVYGGAIYLIQSSEESFCIFQFENNTESPFETTSTTFTYNSAITTGDSIYLEYPNKNCYSEVQQDWIVFVPPNIVTQISSQVSNIDFHPPIYKTSEGHYELELILGQKLLFDLSITDFFNEPTLATLQLYLQQKGSFLDFFPYSMQGPWEFIASPGYNRPNIYIKGPQVSTSKPVTDYKLEVTSGESVHKVIDIKLKGCPLGFYYANRTQTCQCVSDSKVKCDYTLGKACLERGYWLGQINNTYTAVRCPTDDCSVTSTECTSCPMADSNNYCLLPQEENEQCLNNRAGRLCAYCKDGFSFTFGVVNCVSESTCNGAMEVILPCLNLVFMLITFTSIILLLKFNYRLSSGYIFCFVYYFSIVGHLLPPSLVDKGLLVIVSVFESVTQLNPQVLGYLPLCFSKRIDPLEQQVFLYCNPIIISVFVLATVKISKLKCCQKCIMAFKDNTFIKGICLLLLLSFTALTENSFNIVKGISLLGQTYITMQPDIKYFSTKEHLPWFLLASCVFIFLVIPFTLLLLFAPLLSRCFNLNKIKPFLDEFQGCYKDKYRWMAGYYFLCRLVYFLILAIPGIGFIPLQYSIQIISFTILVIHMLLQPYQSKWLNFADSLLLADLTLLTLLYGETGDVVFGNFLAVRQGITFVLIFIPFFYLVVLIFATAMHGINLRRGRFQRRRKSNRGTTLRRNVPTTEIITEDLESFSDYREPVLGLLNSATEEDDSREMYGSCAPATNGVMYSILDKPGERLRAQSQH